MFYGIIRQKKTWTGSGRVNRKKKIKKRCGHKWDIRDIWFGIYFRLKIIVKRNILLERALIFVVFY